MKRIMITLSLVAATLSVHGQLMLDADGDIALKGAIWNGFSVSLVTGEHKSMYIRNEGYTNGTWATALETDAAATGSRWGVGIQATAYSASQNGFSGRNYGVIGRAGNATPGLNYGVFGQLLYASNGAAVLGTISGTKFDYYLTQPYAGFFYGPVKATGAITSEVGFYGPLLTSSSLGSSVPLSLYQAEPSDRGTIVNRLQEVTTNVYYNSGPSGHGAGRNQIQESDTLDIEPELTPMQQQVRNKLHYGLDANELEDVFPDLVYEGEDGTKSINYVEMVPLLVQAIKELKAEISELKGETDSSKKAKAQTTDISDTAREVTLLSLGQNNPNPFGVATSIAVSVPDDVQTAFLYVYNLNGSKVAQVDIPSRGTTSVTLSAATLSEGMYLYSLVTDGKIVQTRRMIVEK